MTTTRSRGPHAELEGCVGRHVPPPLASNVKHLDWYLVARPDRARVLQHTCSRCTTTSYELCLIGGGYLIRRTSGTKRWDSPRVQRTVADQWWQALLDGMAV